MVSDKKNFFLFFCTLLAVLPFTNPNPIYARMSMKRYLQNLSILPIPTHILTHNRVFCLVIMLVHGEIVRLKRKKGKDSLSGFVIIIYQDFGLKFDFLSCFWQNINMNRNGMRKLLTYCD